MHHPTSERGGETMAEKWILALDPGGTLPSVRCRWSGKECDYEGVGGKGYCEGCAREYSGTR